MRLIAGLVTLVVISNSLIAGPHLHSRGQSCKQPYRPNVRDSQCNVGWQSAPVLPVNVNGRPLGREQCLALVVHVLIGQCMQARVNGVRI